MPVTNKSVKRIRLLLVKSNFLSCKDQSTIFWAAISYSEIKLVSRVSCNSSNSSDILGLKLFSPFNISLKCSSVS